MPLRSDVNSTRGRGDAATRRKELSAPSPAVGSQTGKRLRELQRITAAGIMRPLGHPAEPTALKVIKPNDRLTSFERLELYHRQYWFRVLDCLYDDYPGLLGILGERKFYKLRLAYLAKYPSRSFTLRNLGSRLAQFLSEEPQWTAPRQQMCLDMARFEWAQVVAFDGEAKPALAADDLLGADPARLRLAMQPYLTLLNLEYPLDDFVLAVKKRNRAMRSEASNAMDDHRKERAATRPRLPKPGKIFVAVHRFENDLYYKRLLPAQYKLLTELARGATLEQACETALADEQDESLAGKISEWFQTWMELGWFCRRE